MSRRPSVVVTMMFLAVCCGGCSKSDEVWVGEVQLPRREVENLPPGGLQLKGDDDGNLVITAVDLDGSSVSAAVERGMSSDATRAVEDELREAARDVRAAYERVKKGWIIPGALWTRAADREGRGVQAGRKQFSPDARKLER